MTSSTSLCTVNDLTVYNRYFKNGRSIGSGAFGRVNQVVNLENGKVVAAIKHVNLSGKSQRIKRNARQEVSFKCKLSLFVFPFVQFKVKFLEQFSHRHIVKLYSSFAINDGLEIFVIMELCQSDLKQLIKRQNGVQFPIETVLKFCCQILSAIKYLHSRNIIHRDIKPAVICLFFLVLFFSIDI